MAHFELVNLHFLYVYEVTIKSWQRVLIPLDPELVLISSRSQDIHRSWKYRPRMIQLV